MKIVQVNHMFLDGGGREEYVYQLSKRLAEKGNQVKIVTSNYTPTSEEPIGDKAGKIKRLKDYRIPVKKLFLWKDTVAKIEDLYQRLIGDKK